VKEARKTIAAVITFRMSNKNSAMLQQIVKNVALLTQYSVLAEHTTLWSSCPEIVDISWHSLIAHQTPIYLL
jgi:hypothetical protein